MIKPFANDDQAAAIANLNVENGIKAVTISGSLEITRDKRGLSLAQALKQLADALVISLQAEDLPDEVKGTDVTNGEVTRDEVPNPFA